VVTRYADDDSVTVKRLGLIVDIETTGLDPARDRIIELVCLPFHFSSEGVLYDILPGYPVLEDPGQPLHADVHFQVDWRSMRHDSSASNEPAGLVSQRGIERQRLAVEPDLDERGREGPEEFGPIALERV
jgi:hypothetical protein